MRLRALAVALLASAASAFAQTDSGSAKTVQLQQEPKTGPASGATRLRLQLSALRLMGYTETLPSVDDFSSGNRTIPAGTTVKGPLGVVDGLLDVFGTIDGATMVVDGNLRVHPGATIKGDAIT